MRKYLQKLFIRFLVRELFNTIDRDDLIKIWTAKDVYYKGRKLEQSEIDSLKEQAKSLKKSILWKMLTNQVKCSLNEIMYEKGDLMFGQAGLYNLKVFEETLTWISGEQKRIR